MDQIPQNQPSYDPTGKPNLKNVIVEQDQRVPTAYEIIMNAQFLNDFVALEFNGQDLVPAKSMGEATAVLLGTGEIVDIVFFNRSLAPAMGAGMSVGNFVSLATFCGFDRPKFMDDILYDAMVRRIIGNFVLNRNPVSMNNLNACRMIVSLLPEVEFTQNNFYLPSIKLTVDKGLRINLLEVFRDKPDLYETFRVLMANDQVETYLESENHYLRNAESGEVMEEAGNLLDLITAADQIRLLVQKKSEDDTVSE